MKMPGQCGLLACLGLLALVLAPGLPASEPPSRPLELTSSLEAVVPLRLRPMLLERPAVSFLVTVDEEGKLVDYLALEATHYELLSRAEEVLQRAAFRPGRSHGKPGQSSAEVTVNFFDPEQRAYRMGWIALPFGSASMEAAGSRIYEVSKERFVYRRALPGELDQPLTLRAAKIMVLTDAQGRPAAGGCLIDYYVDAKGEIRLPRVVSSDNDTVALSALLTLRNTHFAPVTRGGGVPAYVKVRQPMNFPPPATAVPNEK